MNKKSEQVGFSPYSEDMARKEWHDSPAVPDNAGGRPAHFITSLYQLSCFIQE
jgi:hypothetical protein